MSKEPTTTPGKTDGKAVGSLVFGILSWTPLTILAGIPAVILGHVSRSAIKKSQGKLKGEGIALAGLIMGYLSVLAIPVILIIAAIAIPSLLRARQVANEAAASANLRSVDSAEVQYAATHDGNYGDLESLINAQLLDSNLTETVTGYRFDVVAAGGEFTATATPATPNTGRYLYYVTKEHEVLQTQAP
jgi:type II secretory pathway pseudopilin PulG